MPFTFDPRGGFMRITVTGPLTLEAFVAAFEALVARPSYRPGMNTVWDFRQAPLAGLPTETMRRIVGFEIERLDVRRGACVALVVASDADFGVGRIYEALAADLPMQFQVFRGPDEAERWAAGPEPD